MTNEQTEAAQSSEVTIGGMTCEERIEELIDRVQQGSCYAATHYKVRPHVRQHIQALYDAYAELAAKVEQEQVSASNECETHKMIVRQHPLGMKILCPPEEFRHSLVTWAPALVGFGMDAILEGDEVYVTLSPEPTKQEQGKHDCRGRVAARAMAAMVGDGKALREDTKDIMIGGVSRQTEKFMKGGEQAPAGDGAVCREVMVVSHAPFRQDVKVLKYAETDYVSIMPSRVCDAKLREFIDRFNDGDEVELILAKPGTFPPSHPHPTSDEGLVMAWQEIWRRVIQHKVRRIDLYDGGKVHLRWSDEGTGVWCDGMQQAVASVYLQPPKPMTLREAWENLKDSWEPDERYCESLRVVAELVETQGDIAALALSLWQGHRMRDNLSETETNALVMAVYVLDKVIARAEEDGQ